MLTNTRARTLALTAKLFRGSAHSARLAEADEILSDVTEGECVRFRFMLEEEARAWGTSA